jgi:GT2 family glycosyltransferase
MTNIDVVTTTYRNTEKLKICLSTVLDRTSHVEYKWHLWANDPNDEVKSIIHDSIFADDIMFTDRIEPIFNDTNSGSFSSNNNEAAAEGSADYILFLNDDIEPVNDTWLLNMMSVLDNDPNVGAVGALLVYPDRKTIQHCGVIFSPKTNNLPFHVMYRQSVDKVYSFISVPRYYQCVTAACMLVRRKDFEAVGGFEESYYYMYEDVDLCLKLKEQLNKRCVYSPGAQLIHHEGISGTFKNHPKLNENIGIFRKRWTGKYLNDLEFYLGDPRFMLYKPKVG